MSRDALGYYPPRWAIVLGSLAIAFHLFTALITALHFQSGVWVGPEGPSTAPPPPFTDGIARHLALPYNRLVKVHHHFHFESSRQENQEVILEALAKDSSGKVIGKVQLPDPEANAFVRDRQRLFVRHLIDVPMPPQGAVVLAAPGQQLPTLYWWQPEGERHLKLQRGNTTTVPRTPGLMHPSELAFITARSIGRYTRRVQGISTVELLRTWRDPLLPMDLMDRQRIDTGLLQPTHSSYGELPQ